MHEHAMLFEAMLLGRILVCKSPSVLHAETGIFQLPKNGTSKNQADNTVVVRLVKDVKDLSALKGISNSFNCYLVVRRTIITKNNSPFITFFF